MVKLPTPTQELFHPLLKEKQIQLFVKRDDLIHPEIMGNKWRKLKYNLYAAKQGGYDKIVTMGGAFSNHIAASATAAGEYDFKILGIIRGDELHEKSNPTLEFASRKGMKFRFVSRDKFRCLREYFNEMAFNHGRYYFLPEGGTNQLAVKGCEEILDEINMKFDLIVCPIGTGGTFCGLVSAAPKHLRVMGISSLKGEFIKSEIGKMINQLNIEAFEYEILTKYHFGGFAKKNSELICFINWFKEAFQIPLDPIYTGKSFFAVWDMIKFGKFEKNLKIVLLHTGGLQAISGFNRKNENILQ